MATDDSKTGWPNEDRSLVRTVTELLDSGEYERLAELLDRARLAREGQGDALPAQTLDLARRICLACSQSQAEVEWHQQACEEAAQREDKLRGQLHTLLDLAGRADPIPDAPTPPEPVEPLSLRQRLQELLLRPNRQQLERVPSRGPAPRVEVKALPRHAHAPEHAATAVAVAETERVEEPGPPSLVVYCLGAFRVYQDEQLLTDWPSGRGKSILKYMISHRCRPIAKEVLMDLFWRDADPDAARNNLNVAIYGLRQALRATRPDFSHILFEDDRYLLNPSMVVWVDVEEFQARCESGHELERRGQAAPAVEEFEVAEGLYQGDFFEEDLYEDWPSLQREGLRDSYLVLLEQLSRHYLENQRYSVCIHLCQKILAKDDCREDAHRRLMRCYCRQGQPYLALRQYHLCAETLEKELEITPMADTLALYERIRSGATV